MRAQRRWRKASGQRQQPVPCGRVPRLAPARWINGATKTQAHDWTFLGIVAQSTWQPEIEARLLARRRGELLTRDPVSTRLGRRAFMSVLAIGTLLVPAAAAAMGQSGAFSARRLTTSKQRQGLERNSGLSRWGWELVRRTSAPAKLDSTLVAADSPSLLDEPFAIWCGQEDEGPVTPAERRGLEAFLRLGGILVVDDARPEHGQFGLGARRELRRILPESPPIALSPNSVIYKSFYLVKRPVGRLLGLGHVDAIVRGRLPQVLFLSCDLLGALCTRPDGSFLYDVESRLPRQREQAIRFAVNLAMYVLCSDYKDDQVHAQWLMRRRSRLGR
jgi:hypothetical protein